MNDHSDLIAELRVACPHCERTVATANDLYNHVKAKHGANARLIAAAPDMLEALRLVKQLYAYTGPDADGFAAMVERTIDAALSKASPHV